MIDWANLELLTIDFETYYSDTYSLDLMNTESYIRDPRFETIMASLKYNDGAANWLVPERLEHHLKHEVDWAKTAVIMHHAHFDGGILNFRYDVRPAFFIDTLSMARVIDGPKAKNGLGFLAPRHGLGEKGLFVGQAKNKHYADFTRDEYHQYGHYCNNDVDLTYGLAQLFIPQITEAELRLIDCEIRMFTEPVFVGDVARLRGAVASERARKIALLQRIGLICPRCNGAGVDPMVDMVSGTMPCKHCGGMGVNKKPLGSNPQFADLLRKQFAELNRFNEEPETKPSPTHPEQQIFAFARTDSYMQSLLEDEDEEVRFLAEARVSIKSNIIETRAEKFAASAERGLVPVYITHAGAHTLRPSGGDGTNMLNLSKHIANMARPEMAVLRQSLMAPPGCKVVSVDSSQGEPRILAWQAGQMDLLEAFAQGRDVYSEFATAIYGRHVDRRAVKADYIPGQVAKIGILSYGFGSGWYTAALGFLKGILGAPPIQFAMADMESLQIDPNKFLNSPKKIAQVQAMPSRLVFNDLVIHCVVADALVQRYRIKHDKICDRKTGYWALLESVINCMIRGEEMVFGAHGVMRTGKECIYMPRGHILHYRGVERDQQTGDATYWDGRKRTKIYGSLVAENLTQCIHRIIVGDQMLQIADAGIKVALWPYDEVVAVVPDDAVEDAKQYMIEVMKTSPDWAVGLPLAAEGGSGQTYAEC